MRTEPLIDRISSYLARNPCARLTATEIIEQFDTTRPTVKRVWRQLQDEGLVLVEPVMMAAREEVPA